MGQNSGAPSDGGCEVSRPRDKTEAKQMIAEKDVQIAPEELVRDGTGASAPA